jgi:hypothetical protein
MLLLLTAGITDAHHRGEQEFGCRRLAALPADHHELAPPELARHISRSVTEPCAVAGVRGSVGHPIPIPIPNDRRWARFQSVRSPTTVLMATRSGIGRQQPHPPTETSVPRRVRVA